MIPLALFVIAALWCALTWLHWRKYKRDTAEPYTYSQWAQLQGRTHRRGQALSVTYTRKRVTGAE